MDLRQIILKGFKEGKLNFKTQNEIISALHLSPSYKKPIKATLKKLAEEFAIVKTTGGKYASLESTHVFKATVKAHPQGFAFLIPEGNKEREKDYFAPAKRLKGALNKDVVLAMPLHRGGDEAVVLKILSRGTKFLTGKFCVGVRSPFIVPDDRTFKTAVNVIPSLTLNAQDGDKVAAEITAYGKDSVTAKITAILGRDGDLYAEEDAIIRTAGLNVDFPEFVISTAEKVAAESVKCGDGREDLRKLLTVTIDGADTRDIDDAVSLKKVVGGFELGVHIADVSRYVKRGGCIDKEAYERGTSVYFPDRVLPMLPAALSNGACSLNEGEERYALSCIMRFDKEGNKTDFSLYESVIKSDKRLTYDEVTRILEDSEFAAAYGKIADMLKLMASLCLKLEQKRKEAGAVTLDVKEAHIYLDERGEVVIPDYKRELSHRMIEQFMVCANESVASFAQMHKAPFLYRVHEKPTEEKTELLYSFAKSLGMKVYGTAESATPKNFQKLLSQAEGQFYYDVINKVTLRSMQKARYSEENLKHFGLASDCYCHFTSPIRRYPDLFVHRVLKLLLEDADKEEFEIYLKTAPAAAKDASECERRADEVERDVYELYKTFYMQNHIGEVFEAVVSGVTEGAIFAQLDNTVEGIIKHDYLPSDSYEFFPDKFLLKGRKHSFRIGDKITVKVVHCDVSARRIQFSLGSL